MKETTMYTPDDIEFLTAQSAADEDAELAYQRMMDEEAYRAEQAAADEEAELYYRRYVEDGPDTETDAVDLF
jgi:hypothetical protein